MRILRDTREQRGLSFKSPYITSIIDRKLDVGDYGCEFEDGHVVPIVFERKSIADLFGTLGKGYPRFKRCIIRAQDSGTTLFIITEGTISDVLKGYERSTIEGISVVYKVFTLWARYGVQTIFCADREEMSEYITHFYIACGKEHVRRKEQNVKTNSG